MLSSIIRIARPLTQLSQQRAIAVRFVHNRRPRESERHPARSKRRDFPRNKIYQPNIRGEGNRGLTADSWERALEMLKAESEFERSVGIQCHTTPGTGVSGIHKQRYSDFIVREIRKGQVCHLTDTSTSIETAAFEVPVEPDAAPAGSVQLDALFADIELAYTANGAALPTNEQGIALIRDYLLLCEKQPTAKDIPSAISTHLIASQKLVRTAIHGAFRKHTGKLVETSTEGAGDESRIKVSIVRGHGRSSGGANLPKRAPINRGWPANLPNYTQFTLLKENIDTMSAVQQITKVMHIKDKDGVQYAGTKDKRGITAQQCTVYRKKPSELQRVVQAGLYGATIRVGNFSFVENPIKLGENDGNHFTVTLRQVKQPKEVALTACAAVKAAGFINYYGLQRFGKGARKTHELGRAVFQNDFKTVCDYIFEDSELDLRARNYDGSDIIAAKKCYRCGDYSRALQLLPRSMYSERCIVEALQFTPGNYSGAIQKISKFQRLMYVHAYQSYLWNVAASERVKMHGMHVVEGDIVLSKESAAAAAAASTGEEVRVEDAGARDVEDENVFKGGDLSSSASIHIVTAEDVSAGTYAISDVVMPIYGNKVSFPSFTSSISGSGSGGEQGVAFYDALIARDGLKPTDITHHPNSAYRMGGAYRYLIQMPLDMTYEVLEYTDPDAELTETELVALKAQGRRAQEKRKGEEEDIAKGLMSPPADAAVAAAAAATAALPTLHALRVSFSLGPGAYATMLLREITKESTENMYQAQMSAAAAAVAKTDAENAEVDPAAAAAAGAAGAEEESDSPSKKMRPRGSSRDRSAFEESWGL